MRVMNHVTQGSQAGPGPATSWYMDVTPPPRFFPPCRPLGSPQAEAGRRTVYLSVSGGICMLVKLLA